MFIVWVWRKRGDKARWSQTTRNCELRQPCQSQLVRKCSTRQWQLLSKHCIPVFSVKRWNEAIWENYENRRILNQRPSLFLNTNVTEQCDSSLHNTAGQIFRKYMFEVWKWNTAIYVFLSFFEFFRVFIQSNLLLLSNRPGFPLGCDVLRTTWELIKMYR